MNPNSRTVLEEMKRDGRCPWHLRHLFETPNREQKPSREEVPVVAAYAPAAGCAWHPANRPVWKPLVQHNPYMCVSVALVVPGKQDEILVQVNRCEVAVLLSDEQSTLLLL